MANDAAARLGDFRTRATIQERVRTDDSQGGDTHRYVTVASIWCRARGTGGEEFRAAQRSNPKITWEVESRFSTELRANRRLVFGSTVLNIVAVLDPGGNRLRSLSLCEELQ